MNRVSVVLACKWGLHSKLTHALLAVVADPDHECPWFLCDSGDCIPKSLMCDGINNCFDNTDEAKNSTAHCNGTQFST